MKSPHIPILLPQVLEAFGAIDSGVIVDCTLGYGGHSQALLDALPKINILACDRDEMAIDFCLDRFKNYKNRIEIYRDNFSNIIDNIKQENIRGILADIGVSSLQLDLDERGFGLSSSVLDMRMDKSSPLDAKIVVNEYPKSELERIFRDYGELPNASSLAQKIITARKDGPITSAKSLAKIIGNATLNGRSIRIATLAFQAIRIEVNGELDELKKLLSSISHSKIDNATLCLITFHSLEDKIVKSTFKEWEKSCICPNFALRCECGAAHSLGRVLSKKPITPSAQEIEQNSRASCAKMRVFKIERQSNER